MLSELRLPQSFAKTAYARHLTRQNELRSGP